MATSNKNLHLTDDERRIIQCGIENNSSKKSIADTLGKDKSTIGNEIRDLGLLIKSLLEQGQSLYVICQNHPEIKVSDRTLYTYIEDGVFHDAGVSITNLDLKKKVRRKISKNKKTQYAKRQDRSYLKGRTHLDYTNYMEENPDARIVEMDTVYNDVSNGPFIQTFKFLQHDLSICIYHESKTSDEMLKGSLENVHLLLREICPNKTDLYALGLTSQEKVNIISSHINSYPKKKLKGKSSFQLLEFINPDMADRLHQAGLFIKCLLGRLIIPRAMRVDKRALALRDIV